MCEGPEAGKCQAHLGGRCGWSGGSRGRTQGDEARGDEGHSEDAGSECTENRQGSEQRNSIISSDSRTFLGTVWGRAETTATTRWETWQLDG